MQTNIKFDFSVCEKCVEQLNLYKSKWETSRPSIPQIEGQGTFMDELREIIETFGMLRDSFEALAIDTEVYIQQAVTEMKKIDEEAMKE